MPKKSEYASYVFIKNDLARVGWNTKNALRYPGGQLFTQQECLDVIEIGKGLGKDRPEYVVKIHEDSFWVIEAKATLGQIEDAVEEAFDYAKKINSSKLIKCKIISGVAGNDEDGYLVYTHFICNNGKSATVKYNDNDITGLLSPNQARHLVDNETNELNELITDEPVLMSIAESVNEELHKASINKDNRATVMASVLLSMVSDTLPNFNGSPEVFIKDINNRAEDVLIQHAKRDFAEYIELKLPQENSAQIKYKSAVTKVFFLLRKINIKAAMDGSHDLLGKFYEVFLKYGNGAKDIGIVLTPRHITEFSADILDITAEDLVYDPACGTGGFLVAAYDRVRKNEPDNVEMFKKHKIFGVEQQANVATLAIVNMIFRGDGKNNIINGDCLAINLQRKIRNGEASAEYITDESQIKPINKVLMNPPFALKKEDEQEYTFIDHALKQMTDGGLLLAVVPISVMYSTGDELKWRKRLLERNTLLASISFPNDLFYPQASVEPLVVVILKGISHKPQTKCLFVRITDDGFYKLKRRRLPKTGASQLSQLTCDIRNFIKNKPITSISGIIEDKVLDMDEKSLELIPQNYLNNPPLDTTELRAAYRSLQTEIVFQSIRREISQCK
jgi:type I restriction-modification system DNA methylase subunit